MPFDTTRSAAKSQPSPADSAKPLRIIKLTSVYKTPTPKVTWSELKLPYGIIIDALDRKEYGQRPTYYLFCRDERRIVATEDFAVFMKELKRIKPKSEVDFIDRCSCPFFPVSDPSDPSSAEFDEKYRQMMRWLEQNHMRIVNSIDEDGRHALMCFCESRFEVLDTCE